jgi:hypothetical protein
VEALAGNLAFNSGYTQTAGSTTLNGGTVSSTSTMNIQGGVLRGFGTASASVSNAGEASPGLSPAILNISGTYTQQSAGRYRAEIAGVTQGSGHDQLNVSGAATLAGQLVVDVIAGFTPSLGDSYTLMTFASRGGTTFSSFAPAPPPCGLDWNLVYTDTAVLLQVVPGPCPDDDSDGHAVSCHPSCFLVGGDTFEDCDDQNAAVYPAAPQICDGLNNDCNHPSWPALAGTNEADDDGDAFSECAGDCDDAVGTVYPGAPQICDSLNNDCSDPTWPTTPPLDRDDDGDSFRECTGDCADADAVVYPGAAQACDGVNNDCDHPSWPALAGTNEADDDRDSFTECAGDCDDAEAGAFAVPEEVTGLVFVSDKTTLSWSSAIPDAGSATVHDVVVGIVSELPVGSGASEECLVTTSGSTSSDAVTPGPGEGRWYLVRGRNSCGAGTYGTASDGSTRLTSVCP